MVHAFFVYLVGSESLRVDDSLTCWFPVRGESDSIHQVLVKNFKAPSSNERFRRKGQVVSTEVGSLPVRGEREDKEGRITSNFGR